MNDHPKPDARPHVKIYTDGGCDRNPGPGGYPPALPKSTGLLGRQFSGNLFVMSFNCHDFFERRRDLCGGELVVKGTRVTVRTLLASLAEGASMDNILQDFPTVSTEAMRAVIAFAAASAEEDMPVPHVPATA